MAELDRGVPDLQELEARAAKLGIPGKARAEGEYQFARRIIDVETQVKVMSSTARQLGIDGWRTGESLEAFFSRVAKADVEHRMGDRATTIESDPGKARAATLAAVGRRAEE